MANVILSLSVTRCPSKFMNVTMWEQYTFDSQIFDVAKFTILPQLSYVSLDLKCSLESGQNGMEKWRFSSTEPVRKKLPLGTNSIRNMARPRSCLRCCPSRERKPHCLVIQHITVPTLTELLWLFFPKCQIWIRMARWAQNYSEKIVNNLFINTVLGNVLFPSINYAKTDLRNRHSRRKYSCICLRWGANYGPNASQ
jgi:hypothetical protein